MPDFHPGDIVVRAYSKATNLKRRTFKVLQIHGPGYQSYGTLIEVVDPWGKKHEFRWQQLMDLRQIVYHAESELRSAQQTVVNRMNHLHDLQKQVQEVPKYFPSL